MELEKRLKIGAIDAGERRHSVAEIEEISLKQSRHLRRANFREIHPHDLRRLFELYDDRFFAGQCQQAVGEQPLSFRLSQRMTSAGGKTVREQTLQPDGSYRSTYEIVISTTLLFQAFHDVDRPIVVTGLECKSRFEALQRIFEHELIHLMEMLVWDDSSCSQSRFQSIARRFFGHTEHTHQLITPRERAQVRFDIRPGDHVRFEFDGEHHQGIVNRITKRATVLVESDEGQPYKNGKRYLKFYIPVSQLRKAPKRS